MTSTQRWLQVVMASDRSPAFRGALELMGVAAILAYLHVVALGNYKTLVGRAQLTEVVMVTSGARVNLAVEHALTGQWETDFPVDQSAIANTQGRISGGAFVTSGGGVSVNLRDARTLGEMAGGVVGLRPFFSGTAAGTMMVWSCGSYVPPSGYVTQAQDTTTVAAQFLPNHCKDR